MRMTDPSKEIPRAILGGLRVPAVAPTYGAGAKTLAVSAVASVLLAGPSLGQTAEEAARNNAALALNLCISSYPAPEALAEAFRAAGFQASVTRSTVNSDTDYVFTDPAGSVTVNYYYGEMPESCRITSHTLGVTAASDVLDWIVPQVHPRYRREVTQGAPDSATGQPATCVRYVQPDTPIPFVIGVGSTDDTAGCAHTGASVIFSFSAV